MTIYPTGLVNHQTSGISRLIIHIHAFNSKAAFKRVAMFFGDKEAPQ